MRLRDSADTTVVRQRERGTAILVTLVLIVALLGGGAVLVGMQLQSTRSTEVVRNGTISANCAESGLAAARALVATNYAGWNAALTAGLTNQEPAFLSTLNHDLDNDGTADFTVILKDNDDEAGTPDYTKDNDLQVWLIATCTKFPEHQKKVSELVRVSVGGTCYDSQLGGCGGNGNQN